MKKLVILLALCLATAGLRAQTNVGINNASPVPSAALMVDTAATGPQGMLVPRMNQARRNAIVSPATGLMVYQTDITPGFYYYDGAGWAAVAAGGGPASLLYATNTVAQPKNMYGFSRYTFNFNNVIATASASAGAWTGNNTFTVPTSMGGLYQINLAVLMTAYTYPTIPVIYPEIQVTSGNSVTYYYGVGGSSTILAGNSTDATSSAGLSSSTPFSYGRGIANVTLPLAAGDIVRFYIRSSQNATASTYTASFSTDGSTYLSIVKMN